MKSNCLTLRAVLCLALVAMLGSPAFGKDPNLAPVKNEAGQVVAFEVQNVPSESLAALAQQVSRDDSAQETLQVFVAGEDRSKVPAMAGKLELGKETIRFVPTFKPRAGMTYTMVFRPLAGKEVVQEIRVPAAESSEPTRVAHVYPSAKVLPENQLKFYLHFSAPMSKGEAYANLALIDEETGKKVVDPFLEIGEELWDPTGTRLTLLIDPGRIKKGVKPREDLGTVLTAGKSYRLVIGANWKDAAGHKLTSSFEKSFTASPAREQGMDLKSWKIQPPAAGSTQSLVVDFPMALDHALLERTLAVEDHLGNLIEGKVAISQDEQRWEFKPSSAWLPGKYHLAIDTVLEDLAGNHVGEAFEVDRLTPIEKKVDVRLVRIPLVISADAPFPPKAK